MKPTLTERVGRHEIALYADKHGACALVRIEWRGDVSVEEARAIAKLYAPCVSHHHPIFVTDLSRLGKMPLAAMREIAQSDVERRPESRHLRLGYAVANLRTKMMMSLIIGAGALLSHDTVETAFFDTMEDALAWGERELGKAF